MALVDELKRWSRTFRSVGSADVADLIDKATLAISEGCKDAALAVELYACALTREYLPEQQSVAAYMSMAADILSGSKVED